MRPINLFQYYEEPITLASGAKSRYKIECDAMTAGDWEALAAMAVELLPIRPFHLVSGVPRGGTPFAAALKKYVSERSPDGGRRRVLFCEDVVTTGRSLDVWRREYYKQHQENSVAVGICVFARGECPDWVHPLFRLPGA